MDGELDAIGETLANAQRLIVDSQLLANNERIYSSIILAILGIEEFGKSLILTWGVRNRANKREYPTHIEKQAAVFALLSADEVLGKNQEELRGKIDRGEFNLVSEGGYCEQLAWARRGFYDDVRMAATFSDRDPKIPREAFPHLSIDLARELRNFYYAANLTLRKSKSMMLAAILYANNLGRL